MRNDAERQFVRLIFDVSGKYASWDPEVPIEVGDYGRITSGNKGFWFWRRRKGVFLKEGNIYKDGKAKDFEIPSPNEHGVQADGTGVAWIVSQNAVKIDFDVNLSTTIPAFAECGVRAGFHFFSTPGAILAMQNDTISTIDPPGSLRELSKHPTMANRVIVSEVHRCSSYMRALTSSKDRDIFCGLSAQPPAPVNVGEVAIEGKWVTSYSAGNFRSKVDANGERSFYPLFRLVSFRGTDVTTGLRGAEEEDLAQSLPDAVPPWDIVDKQRVSRSSFWRGPRSRTTTPPPPAGEQSLEEEDTYEREI